VRASTGFTKPIRRRTAPRPAAAKAPTGRHKETACCALAQQLPSSTRSSSEATRGGHSEHRAAPVASASSKRSASALHISVPANNCERAMRRSRSPVADLRANGKVESRPRDCHRSARNRRVRRGAAIDDKARLGVAAASTASIEACGTGSGSIMSTLLAGGHRGPGATSPSTSQAAATVRADPPRRPVPSSTNLLEIVQHQQHVLLIQKCAQLRQRILLRELLMRKCTPNGSPRDQIGHRCIRSTGRTPPRRSLLPRGRTPPPKRASCRSHPIRRATPSRCCCARASRTRSLSLSRPRTRSHRRGGCATAGARPAVVARDGFIPGRRRLTGARFLERGTVSRVRASCNALRRVRSSSIHFVEEPGQQIAAIAVQGLGKGPLPQQLLELDQSLVTASAVSPMVQAIRVQDRIGRYSVGLSSRRSVERTWRRRLRPDVPLDAGPKAAPMSSPLRGGAAGGSSCEPRQPALATGSTRKLGNMTAFPCVARKAAEKLYLPDCHPITIAQPRFGRRETWP